MAVWVLARQDKAWHEKVWHGMNEHGITRKGMAWQGKAGQGRAGQGRKARQGRKAGQDSVVRCRTDECNVIQCGPQSKILTNKIPSHRPSSLRPADRPRGQRRGSTLMGC